MSNPSNILTLGHKDAFNFFLTSNNYCSTELPVYISFEKILDYVRKSVGEKPFSECVKAANADYTGVNLSFLMNKDGKYAVRPLVVSNPFLYYFLVREICQPDNWKAIGECFQIFNLPYIQACAIPVLPAMVETFHNSTTILNWWKLMEQQSLELSLDYKYMFVTDITNCYGSINPQTIDWALSRKGTSHSTDANHLLAQTIIAYLQKLMEGKNIGIPQGSTLYDFISEIILGYADLLLAERIEKKYPKLDYRILRYRDDYHIFCNDKGVLEEVSYMLQQVLEELGFRMNSGKTKITSDVVADSIKPDKLFSIFNTPIFQVTRNNIECDFTGFERIMLYILQFGRRYPNSGQVKVLLSQLNAYVEKRLKLQPADSKLLQDVDLDGDDYKSKKLIEPLKKDQEQSAKNIMEGVKVYIPGMVYYVRENIKALAAVLVQIGLENVSAVPYALQVLSNLLLVVEDDAVVKASVVEKVYNRLCKQPNSDYTQVWLQHITYNDNVVAGKSPYTLNLCRLVWGDNVALWQNNWLKSDLATGLPYDQICDRERAKDISPKIKISRPMGGYDVDEYDIECSL